MYAYAAWNVDASQILSRRELALVLTALKKRAARLPNVQMNLAIVRLACCCGLRASEIGGLTLGDVNVGITRPFIQVRAEHAKLGRPRRVPLWWDAGTLEDLTAWLERRRQQGAKSDDPFVCSLQSATFGEPLNRHVLAAPVPHRLPRARLGSATHADDSSRSAHVHQPCAGGRQNTGRGQSCSRAREFADDERVSACGGGRGVDDGAFI